MTPVEWAFTVMAIIASLIALIFFGAVTYSIVRETIYEDAKYRR